MGRLVTWQSIPTLAKETGLSEQTVRRAIRRLRDYGHLAVKIGGGRSRSNLYTLKTLSPVAGYSEAKPYHPCQAFDGKTLPSATANPDKGDRKPYHRCHQNPSTKELSNLSEPDPESDVASRGPRGLEGLGPLATLDADLRLRLGKNATWLEAAKPTELTDGVLTLSVLTAYQSDNIRKHCEAEILAAASATELKFIVAGPPKARRRS